MQRRRSVLALAVPTLLALAGCGGSDDDADTATSISSATTTTTTTMIDGNDGGTGAETTTAVTDAPVTAAPVTEAPVTDPPATTAAPTTAAPADDGSCLVGSWVVTESQMNDFYGGLMSTLDAPLEIAATGSAALTFDSDGTYGWAPAFTLAVTAAGQSGTGVTSGSITGNWAADGNVIVTSSEVNALDVSVTVAGVTFEGSDMANGYLNASPVNGTTYSCDGPVVDFRTGDPGVTVPITLTPA